MIVQKDLGNGLVETYSDKNVMIQGGYPYGLREMSIDPISMGRVFEETDIPIPEKDVTAEEIVNILTGEENDQ